eukprot:GGOE01049261.1.p1 GENE.GGOE01049261.1~~GGOE01049261.1.p1  ORF type:complete len:213 (-),score=33.63 GGOE01049261.1:235-873(-)
MGKTPENEEEPIFVYRQLTRDDLQDLAQLQKQLFPVDYNEAFYEKLLSPDIKTVLAFHEEAMVGVITGRVKVNKGWFTTRRSGYIITLGVEDQFRRHRLGSTLLMKLQAEFERQQCQYIYLHCKTDNDPALTFYKKHKYSITRRLQSYYYIAEAYHDAYVLVKALDCSAQRPFEVVHRLLSLCWNCLLRPVRALFGRRRRKLKAEVEESDGV